MSVKQIVKTYLFDLAENCRLRHRHVRVQNKVVDFAVQVELYVNAQWVPIVRYDTAHGFAHKDLFIPERHVEKMPLSISDYNEALTFAENDLKLNWPFYRERYLKGD